MTIANSINVGTNTKYVVDSGGNAPYTTIQSALNAANSAGVAAEIFVRPGSYSENLTLYSNLTVVGGSVTNTTINGQHTPPTTGIFQFRNLGLTSTAADIFASAVAGSANLYISRCRISVLNGYVFDLPNWNGELRVDNSTSTGGANDGFANVGIGTAPIVAYDSDLGRSSSLATINGNFTADSCVFGCAFDITNGVSNLESCVFQDRLLANVNSTMNIRRCTFDTGTAEAINTVSANLFKLTNCVINTSNANAINGAGAATITMSGCTFENSKVINPAVAFEQPVTKVGGLDIVQGVSNNYIGQDTLVAGTKTVNTSRVLTTSLIFLSHANLPLGRYYVSAIVSGVSFTVTSTAAIDVGTFNWLIINPA